MRPCSVRSPNSSASLPASVAGSLHRHLLPENRAHRQLEAVPGSGHAQTRPARDRSLPATDHAADAARSPPGSAPRSNMRRTRSRMRSRARGSGKCTRNSRQGIPFTGRASRKPLSPSIGNRAPIAITGDGLDSRSHSARKNASSACQSYGGRNARRKRYSFGAPASPA